MTLTGEGSLSTCVCKPKLAHFVTDARTNEFMRKNNKNHIINRISIIEIPAGIIAYTQLRRNGA